MRKLRHFIKFQTKNVQKAFYFRMRIMRWKASSGREMNVVNLTYFKYKRTIYNHEYTHEYTIKKKKVVMEFEKPN